MVKMILLKIINTKLFCDKYTKKYRSYYKCGVVTFLSAIKNVYKKVA